MTDFHASTPSGWRTWLAENAQSETEIWLIIHHKDSPTPSIRYHEAIEHALCYGWIDSHHLKNDADSSRLRFTPRNPRSGWSAVNRKRAATMTELGLMTPAGQAMIDLAKAKGTWQVDSAVPADLQELLHQNETAHQNFQKFPLSSRRLILEWIATAKKPETRQRRVTQTAALAAQNIRANHPGVKAG